MTSDFSDQQDYAGTPRPDAVIPVLDQGQLAALGEVGQEWGRVSAGPQVWRQALPVDPALGEYPAAGEVRPARFTKVVPVAGRDGQLPPIETTSAAEASPDRVTWLGQRLRRLLEGPPLHIAQRLRRALRALPGIVVTSVPFHLAG